MKKDKLLLSIICLSGLVTLTGCINIVDRPSYNPDVPYPLTSEDIINSKDKILTYVSPNKAKNKRASIEEEFLDTKVTNLTTTYNDVMNQHLYGYDCSPSVGDINLLIIPINLKGGLETTEDLETTRNKIYSAFFGENLYYESVSSYFYKSSYGNLSISGDVTDWFNVTDFYDYRIKEDDTLDVLDMAVNWAKTLYSDLDFTKYDSDKDGYLDGVVLIYDQLMYNNPYYDRHKLVVNDNLWAYTSWYLKTTPDVDNPNPKSFFWASYDFLNVTKACGGIDTHTYIHETGHLFGLDDYYNYDTPSSVGASGGAIMQANNIGDHDPYSKMALGWINPLSVLNNTSVTIRPFSTSGDVIILSPKDLGYVSWNEDFVSPFDEYFMIDFYTSDGLHNFDSKHGYGGDFAWHPKMPKAMGVRIWHVDARLAKFNNNSFGLSDYEYEIVNEVNKNDTSNKYVHLTSNTPSGDYASFDKDFRDYRLLHLLQRGGNNTFDSKKTHYMSEDDLFKSGDVFALNKYYNLMPTHQATFNSCTEKQTNDTSHIKAPFEIHIGEMTNEKVTINIEVK